MGANDNNPGGSAVGLGAAHPTHSDALRAAEEAALAAGEAARHDLAVETARQLLVDPRVLDRKRLGRLGRDGVAILVAELQRLVPSPVRRWPDPNPAGPPAPAPSLGTGAKGRPTLPLDGFEGWWERPRPARFEQLAYRRGLILGAFLVLALVYAFVLSGF